MTNGPVIKAEDLARDTLADCARFRTWIGAAGDDATQQTQARNRIHDIRPPPADLDAGYEAGELGELRPYAALNTDEEGGFRRRSDGRNHDGTSVPSDSGTIVIGFHQSIPARLTNFVDAAIQELKTDMSVMIDELWALAGRPGYLDVQSLALYGPHEVTAEGDDDDDTDPETFLGAVIELEWGVG